MAAHAFGAILQHESSVSAPAKTHLRAQSLDDIPATWPSNTELDNLQWGSRLNGPTKQDSVSSEHGYSEYPATPGRLEQSQQPITNAAEAFLQSATNPARNRWRLAAAALMFLLVGMNDGVTGALLPYIEADYSIGYDIVSLLFITYASGFVAAAPALPLIDARLGRAMTYMLACSLLSAGYISISCHPPYPVVVVSFLFLGFGVAIFLASANSWIVNLVNGTVLLSCMHGMYGIGGIISPLIATAMVTKGIRWSYFYFIPLGLALGSIGFMGWSYRGFEADASEILLTSLERVASRRSTVPHNVTKRELLARSVKNRTTALGAIFIFFYQGGEVAISGWVISYLIHFRDGNPAKVGNVTSGFWGGITLGRFILTPLSHKMGEKFFVVGLILGAAAFQALVWAVPSIIANAVAESIVGFFLGPVYPCATAVFSKLWPRQIQISSLSLVTSMGSSGGALVPFVTGLMAQSISTVVLHPIVLFALGSMMTSWLLLPKISKRTE